MFRQRGRFCLSTDLLTHFSQEEPFDLSQKPPGRPSLLLSQSDGESVPGSSCLEEDEESLYRRSQYSPEVDPHELEETRQGSPAELRPGEKQKQMYQHSLNEQTCKEESAAEPLSVDPRSDKVHRLQSEDTPKMVYEPGLELGDQVHHHEKGRRQSYDYDTDSELEDHHQELNEPEQSKRQAGDLRDARERNQSKLETREIMRVTGQHDEKDKE